MALLRFQKSLLRWFCPTWREEIRVRSQTFWRPHFLKTTGTGKLDEQAKSREETWKLHVEASTREKERADILVAEYGDVGRKRVAALEAQLNANFDRECEKRHPVLWPQLPLRD